MIAIPIFGLILLAGLTIFQLLLILGKPLGDFAWGGQHKVLPKKLRIASAASILLYVIFAIFLANKAGFISILSDSVTNVGMWAFTGYFILGIFVNLISRNKKERWTMAPVSLLLAAVFLATTLQLFPTHSTNNKPVFSFDAGMTPDWISGGNIAPNINDYTDGQVSEENLPVASINVYRKEQNTPDECFIMSSYYAGSIDTVNALKELEAQSVFGNESTYTLVPLETSTRTIETFEGTKEYQLHQYDLQTPPATEVMKGVAFAHIPLSEGYIEVRNYCKAATNLSSTLPALAEISLQRS